MPNKSTEIEVLSKSLDVLEFLATENFKPKTVNQIMEKTQLKRNSVDRILQSLQAREYVAKNARREWQIGSKLSRFAQNYSDFVLNVIAQK